MKGDFYEHIPIYFNHCNYCDDFSKNSQVDRESCHNCFNTFCSSKVFACNITINNRKE